MLEGRTRFPRYDTVQALAQVLGASPAQLMGDTISTTERSAPDAAIDDNMDLMVEIITRLQEVAASENYQLQPREFAAMAATIYRQMQADGLHKRTTAALQPKIHDLLAYETLKRKTVR